MIARMPYGSSYYVVPMTELSEKEFQDQLVGDR
jgi:hypothetical protein